VPLAGGLACIPLLVAAVKAAGSWYPSSDSGVIVLRAFDVLSPHPPLLGQWSQASSLTGELTYALGPLEYWLLAIPAHVGPAAVVLTMGAINVACVVGAVLLAGRRGGPPLGIATALALVLVSRSLPVEVSYEVWNCWAGVFPFTLLLFAAWSVACGDHRLLPLLALVATYTAQVHFTYVVPTLAALAVAIVGLVAARPLRPRRWVIASAVVALACWSGPLIDEIQHRPGNLERAYQLATDDHDTVGGEIAWSATARTIGVPPWWLRSARSLSQRLVEPQHAPLATRLSAVAVFAALLTLLALALRRRRHDLIAGLALALLMVVSVAIVAGTIPTGQLGFAALAYVLVWASPAGMWAWLMLAWAGWGLRPLRAVAPAWAGATAVALVGAVAIAIAAGRDYDDPERFPPGMKEYAALEQAASRVSAGVARDRTVLLDVPPLLRESIAYRSAIAYRLRRDGVPFVVAPVLAKEMGSHYRAGRGGYEDVVRVRDARAPTPEPGRVLVEDEIVRITVAGAR
jgi:hypothetical protein